MVELLVCIFISSAFSIVLLNYSDSLHQSYRIFPDQYLYLQSESMRCSQPVSYIDPLNEISMNIHFNGIGNVNTAMTVPIKIFGFNKIVVELGMGRLVFYGEE